MSLETPTAKQMGKVDHIHRAQLGQIPGGPVEYRTLLSRMQARIPVPNNESTRSKEVTDHVNIKVIMTVEGKTGPVELEAEDTSRLGDDDVQITAAGLAYGLVEDAWGVVEDD